MLQKLKLLILSTALISSISALNLDVETKIKDSNSANTINIESHKFSEIRDLNIISKNKCDKKLLEKLELWLRKLDQKIINQKLKKEVIQERLNNKLLKLIEIEYLDGIKILVSLGAVIQYKKEIDCDKPLIKAIIYYHPSLMRTFLIDRASTVTNIGNNANIYNDYEPNDLIIPKISSPIKLDLQVSVDIDDKEESSFSLSDILRFLTK